MSLVGQISIGASTTQLLHNLSSALNFQPGDEIIISKLNHEANTAPWVRIAERLGLTVKWWSAGGNTTTNPVCDLDELRSLLSDKTRIVACPHASNVTGTITKVKEIADLVHSFPKACLFINASRRTLYIFVYYMLTTTIGFAVRRRCRSGSTPTGRCESS
jgi:selenocysteine lyase/cysteine desulfurase